MFIIFSIPVIDFGVNHFQPIRQTKLLDIFWLCFLLLASVVCSLLTKNETACLSEANLEHRGWSRVYCYTLPSVKPEESTGCGKYGAGMTIFVHPTSNTSICYAYVFTVLFPFLGEIIWQPQAVFNTLSIIFPHLHALSIIFHYFLWIFWYTFYHCGTHPSRRGACHSRLRPTAKW